MIAGRGCELIYLQLYLPDFNPIEEAFSKIKNILRRIEAQTRDALVGALSEAISAVTARERVLRAAGDVRGGVSGL